jgi:hypothetical protein
MGIEKPPAAVTVWRLSLLSAQCDFCLAVRAYLLHGIIWRQVFNSVAVAPFQFFFMVLFASVCSLLCSVGVSLSHSFAPLFWIDFSRSSLLFEVTGNVTSGIFALGLDNALSIVYNDYSKHSAVSQRLRLRSKSCSIKTTFKG